MPLERSVASLGDTITENRHFLLNLSLAVAHIDSPVCDVLALWTTSMIGECQMLFT